MRRATFAALFLVGSYELAARGGSEFWIPFRSIFIPGLGQYIHGAPWTGAAHTQKLGGRFWLANVVRAGLFGLGHPQAGSFAVVIGAGGAYNGWLTRRNGWSIREATFQHFWYDVAVATATLLRDDRSVITLAPVTIHF